MKQLKRTQRAGRRWKTLALAAGLAGAGSVQATTTIEFDGAGLPQNTDIPQSYGDFASANGPGYTVSPGISLVGTPNIDISWGAGVSHSVDWYDEWDGRGAVAQIDYNIVNPITITFTPDASSAVLINSFVLDAWAGGGDMGVLWTISDQFGTLASDIWTRTTGGRDTIFTGLSAADIHAGEIVTLTFQGFSGKGSYFGLDNFSFDQVVQPIPEPSVMALAAAGAIGLTAFRRRL